jgi:hypothetical protein
MKLERLLELSGQPETQINELKNIEVVYNIDTIESLKMKLKKQGVDISTMNDALVLKFANAMNIIGK